jgi:hypothetical protein
LAANLSPTAFIQERSAAELKVPSNLGKVLVQITPGFDPSDGRGATTLVVPVNSTYGTSHVVIPVPASAPPANYQLNLYTVGPTGASLPDGQQPIPLDVPLDVPLDDFSGEGKLHARWMCATCVDATVGNDHGRHVASSLVARVVRE